MFRAGFATLAASVHPLKSQPTSAEAVPEAAATITTEARVEVSTPIGKPVVPSSPLKEALLPAVPPAAQELRKRTVMYIMRNDEQPEGQGARVRRSIGSRDFDHFDPILLLDHFTVQAPAGFPDHMHRGFETVTFVLPESGNTVNHEDFAGHSGEIGPGDVQWMTAGRGIVHAEMPGKGNKPAIGIQMWVNLAAKNKMIPPRYQERLAKEIPTVVDSKQGVSAYIIAGTALGVSCPIQTLTPTHYIYFQMQPGAVLHHMVPNHWNAFIYSLGGNIQVLGRPKEKGAVPPPIEVAPFHTVFFDRSETKPAGTSPIDAGSECANPKDCDVIVVEAGSNSDGQVSSFILVAAEPLHEPVARHGPVVMNTREELYQAFNDYRNYRNGFERARGFESKIVNGVY